LQRTLLTVENHITSLEPYATLADEFSEYFNELKRRHEYKLRIQQRVEQTRSYFTTQREEESTRRQIFRQLRLRPDSLTYRLLTQLVPALTRESSLPPCEITLPPFDVDLSPIEPTQLGNENLNDDDFSLITDSNGIRDFTFYCSFSFFLSLVIEDVEFILN
jgi:hypothetical protein